MDQSTRPLCPCCQRPLDTDPTTHDIAYLPLPPNSRVAIPVMNILARAFPRGVMPDVLADHVYGLRVDGGPDSGVKSLAVVIGHLRLKLAPYGWTISDARKGEGYRLERVAAQ